MQLNFAFRTKSPTKPAPTTICAYHPNHQTVMRSPKPDNAETSDRREQRGFSIFGDRDFL
ncbi:hypothetical protein [Pseudanabaena minima]|uniref:hypothetical protein n=1 Tax=Pseudanabaena minima TaxID=890415 RepID=UPI003DA94327